MITNKVLKLNQDTTLSNGVKLPMGQEIEIVMDVVYMGGFPLPPNMQLMLLNWINTNPNLFTETTLKW
jgi:hypothetical protein